MALSPPAAARDPSRHREKGPSPNSALRCRTQWIKPVGLLVLPSPGGLRKAWAWCTGLWVGTVLLLVRTL